MCKCIKMMRAADAALIITVQYWEKPPVGIIPKLNNGGSLSLIAPAMNYCESASIIHLAVARE